MSHEPHITASEKNESEIQRRIEQIKQSSTTGIPAEQVFKFIDNKYS